ncbi:MAG: cysteine--tRNA ligase [Deltaproteobacteria bacterium]|jgi:cysteinyl-tRNA synthetase|nr:cysteine--tRNA ligase [Deltaproteobacteria bacterium]
MDKKNKKQDIYIFNTLSLSKERFKPINEDKVLMYVCGITAYDLSHIGHARAYITFDIIYRFLKNVGYNVIYVRNFTDIDDKIIKKANEEKKTTEAVSSKYIDEYHKDMDALNVLSPSYEPKATETIPEMIEVASKLIDKGNAYEINGDVFFRVNSFKDYGKLSHKNIDELIAGSRIPINEEKENFLDFALWKKSKEGEPSWDSPWGKGRPGWHIECSAMSMKFLGESIDIHGGGSDLIFPHHENEIAQSESYTGKNFVNYWIHNGFVNINSEKMSKSLKNFITVRDVLEKFHPESLRLFFMFTHYRSFIDFSYEGIESARQSLLRLYQSANLYNEFKKLTDEKRIVIKDAKEKYTALKTANSALTSVGNNGTGVKGKNPENIESYSAQFYDSMSDDFNTAKALSVIFDLVRKTNKIIKDAMAQNFIERQDLKFLDLAMIFMKHSLSDIFGILNEDPKLFIESNSAPINYEDGKTKISPAIAISGEEIEKLIERRNELRNNKEYASADKIRKSLLEKGVALEDTNFGTTYKITGVN